MSNQKLQWTPRMQFTLLKLITSLVIFFLIIELAVAAPGATKNEKITTSPKPVVVPVNKKPEVAKNLIPSSAPTTLKDVTTASTNVKRPAVPLSNWSLGEKEIGGCPDQQIRDDNGNCRPSAAKSS